MLKPFLNGKEDLFKCWMYDMYSNFRNLLRFRRQTAVLRGKLIQEYVNSSKFTVMDENCPLFSYFINVKENVISLQKRGYFTEKEIKSVYGIHSSNIVKRVFQYNLRLRSSVISTVNSIINPYESILKYAGRRIQAPPFKTYSNLVSTHIRFGKGGADFEDSNQFLREDSIKDFIKCVKSQLHKDDLIFVASDSKKAKEAFIKVFGKRVIVSRDSSMHSAVKAMAKEIKYHNNSQYQPVIDAMADIIVASMSTRFVGTSASTFSAMCVMLGATSAKYNDKQSHSCHSSGLYLPF